MTDIEREALTRRIDELCQENERLHADQAHWELGNCPNCPNVVSLQEALEQNAKLRGLLSDYSDCLDTALLLAADAGYPVMPARDKFLSLEKRKRELGVVK